MSSKEQNKRASPVMRILAPGECSDEELQSFARFVRQGEQVTSVGLESRIAAAAWLGFARLSGRLAGVAALKNPRPVYRNKVFSAAKVAMFAFRFPLEFGWVLVSPQFRRLGIAKALLWELTARNSDAGIFATTNTNNQFMQRILKGAGFEILGQPFQSARTDASNLLWVRPDEFPHDQR